MSALEITSPERWRQVKAIVADAMDAAPDERTTIVDRACGDDLPLRREVESLLAAAKQLQGDAQLSAFQSALAARYRIDRELGRGGMATVFLAEDLRNARRVAIKVLSPAIGPSQGASRFLAEIRTTARLQHPHIVPLFDSGEAAGQLYYVMPCIAGESLRTRLRHHATLSLAEALTIATQIAAALGYAHSAGVVHRDVKPENILLHDAQAFVADFGIARALDAVDGRLTGTGVAVGTPVYMSPEQASGERDVDGRTDVYALGCVLYEMLAGAPPFGGASAAEVVGRKLSQEAPPLRAIRNGMPSALDELLARMLARDPALRPIGAELDDGLEALRRVASPSPAMPSRRHGRLALAVGIVVTVLAATTFVARSLVAGRSTLDPNLIVVAPFATVGLHDPVWREGLTEWLGRELDGAGPLRTVATSAALRAWRGDHHADRASAVALARSTGAGLALLGTLSAVGADSTRIMATLVDARMVGVVSEREAAGPSDHLTRLADSVARGILLDLAERRGTGTVRPSGSMGSASLPAIRAFLRGDQAFRRAEWDSAQTYYEQAVARDSTFALAIRQLGRVSSWRGADIGVGRPRADSAMLAYATRASRFAHGLGPRDSLLIVADSLIAALAPDLCAQAEPRRRLLRTTSTLTSRFPSDAEAWVAHGDAQYVCGGYVTLNEPGIGKREMLQAYDSAIALDPGLALAYDRAFRLALDLGDTALVLRRAATYLGLHPSVANAAYLHLITALLRRPADAAAILDTASAATAWATYASLLLYPDSAELQVTIGRRLASTAAHGGTWDVYRGGTNGSDMPAAPLRHRALALAEAYRGHLRAAAARVGTERSPFASRLTVDLALLGAIRATAADSAVRAWLHERPARNPEGMASALAWWGARRDTAALLEYLDDPARLPNRMGALRVTAREQIVRAYLALARGDTSTSIELLVSLPTNEWWIQERLVAAHLLAARGRVAEAFALLDRGFPYPFATPLRGVWAADHARLASALGERAKARESYAYVVELWRAADPELQPIVQEARAALSGLGKP